jgi:hypothetical protein
MDKSKDLQVRSARSNTKKKQPWHQSILPKLDLTDEESQLSNNLGISDDISLGIPPSEIRPTRKSSSGSPKTPVRGATSKTSNTERVGSPKTPIWADDNSDVGIRGERTIKTVTTEDILDLTSMTSSKLSSKNPKPQRPPRPPMPTTSESEQSSKPKKMASAKTLTTSRKIESSRSPKKSQDSMKTINDLVKVEDPILERELEDIALHGRSGLISGAASAKSGKDVETGSIKSSDGGSKAAGLAGWKEDDADKSWHSSLSNSAPVKRNWRRIWIIAGLGISLIIVAIVLGVVVAGGDSEQTARARPSVLTGRQEMMDEIISKGTDQALFQVPTSAQYKARQWLLYSDTLQFEMIEGKVLQRFALATFYYATNGDESWNKNDWLEGDECEDDFWHGLNCNGVGEVRALAFGKYKALYPRGIYFCWLA